MTLSGALKSGSPTPSEITLSMALAKSKNLRMPDGGIETTRGTIFVFQSMRSSFKYIISLHHSKDAHMFQCNKKPHLRARLFIFCGPLITVFSMLPGRSRSRPDRWLPARIRYSVRHCRDRRLPRRARAAADPERGNRIFHRIPPSCGRKA